jgi:predicted ATP-dependent serine protease
MTREEDIWVCYECEQLQGRHDQWFEGKCEKCHEKDLENE